MGSVYVVTKKSSVSFWTSLIGALINIGLNLWLIPRIGIQGAAAATFASCLAVFLVRTVSTRRLLPFSLSSRKLVLGISALLVQTAFILLRWPGWIAAQALSLTFLFLLGLPAILSTGTGGPSQKVGITMILTAFHGFCMALADSVLAFPAEQLPLFSVFTIDFWILSMHCLAKTVPHEK